MRATLVILAACGALAVCLGVAVVAGWVRLSTVGSFARIPVATTRPLSSLAANGGEGEPSATSPTTEPVDPIPEPPAPPDRTIVLRAKDARVSGTKARVIQLINWGGRLRQPISTSIVTGWTTPEDVAEWTADVPRPGKYSITLDYATGWGKKGPRDTPGGYVLTAGEQKISGQLRSTRSGQSFELVDVGTVELPRGPVKVMLRPADHVREPMMNLRSVRLFPAD